MNLCVRKAVGAIIIQAREYLLVYKVKNMSSSDGPVDISGVWDFPKGGVQAGETEIEALLRELREETGSQQYRILKQFDEKIVFTFHKEAQQQTGYSHQETTMFLVEYSGDRTDLSPQDDEIAQVRFFPAENVIQYLSLDETRHFYVQHKMSI
jgi:putative (di)nucleoside polyphosphate hydrolase